MNILHYTHCGPQNNEVQQLTLFSARPHHFFSKYPSSKQETAKLATKKPVWNTKLLQNDKIYVD